MLFTLSVLLALAMILGLAAYVPAGAQSAKPTIVIAYDGDIDHIEPMEFRSVSAYDATANLYEPLITQKLVANDMGELIGQNEFEAAGAETWDVSEDGTVFTFHLRQDAKFADGTPITANDYKYTFDRAMTGPGYIGLLTPFMALSSADAVQVLDDYTLQITTDRPAALTENVLGFQVFGAISQATAEAHATADDPWAENFFRTDFQLQRPLLHHRMERGRAVHLRAEPELLARRRTSSRTPARSSASCPKPRRVSSCCARVTSTSRWVFPSAIWPISSADPNVTDPRRADHAYLLPRHEQQGRALRRRARAAGCLDGDPLRRHHRECDVRLRRPAQEPGLGRHGRLHR